MEWHKISDGDYPDVGDVVLISSVDIYGKRNTFYCQVYVASINEKTNEYIWCGHDNFFYCKPTDRWAHIDLPTD